MNKHTPGPWEAREVSQNWIEILASDLVIGTVLPTQYVSLGRSPEQQANARLIAAAPELLEALHAMLDEHADCKGCDASNLAFAAIAKAEGR